MFWYLTKLKQISNLINEARETALCRWVESFSLRANCSLLRHILVLTVLTRWATVYIVIFTILEQGKNRKVCHYLWTNTGKEEAKMWRHPCLLCILLQIQESMEPERTASDLASDLQAGKTTGGSPESYKQKSTMQDILSEIQSLVERSNIINVSINWFWLGKKLFASCLLVRSVAKHGDIG